MALMLFYSAVNHPAGRLRRYARNDSVKKLPRRYARNDKFFLSLRGRTKFDRGSPLIRGTGVTAMQ